jgi:two-component system cell cycle sensor histidine kinase/response regulator CckA
MLYVAAATLTNPVRGNKMNQNGQVTTNNNAARILLVEDDNAFRFAITTELRSRGYMVFSAEDGQRALELIENSSAEDGMVDMIITDVVMPRLNGLRFVEELAKTSLNIPVVAMSGFMNPGTKEVLTSMGVKTTLEKPFSPEKLTEVVGTILEGRT